MSNGWRTIKSWVHKISTSRSTRERNGWILLARKIKARTAEGRWMRNPVWPRLVRPTNLMSRMNGKKTHTHTHCVSAGRWSHPESSCAIRALSFNTLAWISSHFVLWLLHRGHTGQQPLPCAAVRTRYRVLYPFCWSKLIRSIPSACLYPPAAHEKYAAVMPRVVLKYIVKGFDPLCASSFFKYVRGLANV